MDIIGLLYGIIVTIAFIFINLLIDLASYSPGIVWYLHIFGPVAIIGAIIPNYYVLTVISVVVGCFFGWICFIWGIREMNWLCIPMVVLSLIMLVRCIVYFVNRNNDEHVYEEAAV
uniref:Integral membrane protein n=1 Tax=Acrobeloides nanus TaxID=290746 RepID=A0A914CK59_9BILA